MTTYTWSVIDLKRNTDGGVYEATFTVTASDGTKQATFTGQHGFNPDPSAPDFIAYDDLTETTVLNWIHTMIGSDAVEATQDLANNALTQAKLTGLPW